LFAGIKPETLPVKGAVVPHAGYIYSGGVAAAVYSSIPAAQTFVLIGPNHYGIGMPVAMSLDVWRTPLGTVQIDLELARKLDGSIIAADEVAHEREHSIEVQLPFIQRSFSDSKVLPIAMGLQDIDTAVEVGGAVGSAIASLGRSAVVLASSDFTHYESHESARRKDASLIEAINNMDVEELYRRVEVHQVSACGIGPIAATMVASQTVGAKAGRLLRYSTSADATGDYSSVVGYSAIVFT
jgi:AmmeMemoRadiSam system protein B